MAYLFKFKGFIPFIVMVFLNAFVDLGHKIIIQNTVFKVYDGTEQIVLTAIVNGLILLPFIMLLSPAGYCADKFPKNKVMRISAWLAVGITLCITLFYYLGWFWPAFAMTFLLALQSAFYSPAKYGYIKELVGKDNLAGANGVVQAATTIAILAGIFAFSILFESLLADVSFTDTSLLLESIAPIGWALVAFSIVELCFAYGLPAKQKVDDTMNFDWKIYTSGSYLKSNLRSVTDREVIFLSVIGLSIFWSLSQVMLSSFPAYAKESMGIMNTIIIQGTLACAGLGIMMGSIIAGRISKTHIETGMIPIGSIGIAVCLLALPMVQNIYFQMVNFFAWGVFGGLLLIPLNALIQFHSEEDEVGRVLAGNNFIQNIFMISFLGLTVIFALMGMGSIGLFNILFVVAVVGTIYTIYKLPQSLVRFIIGYIIGHRYRLEVLGLKNIPETGGVLMLGNHISWIDWGIIQMASPRPIRFVMIRNIYERWYLKWFLDIFNVIPISTGASRSALQEISDSLNKGDVVCLFPEGTISRTGQLAEFQRGYEKAAEDTNAVILPFYLRGLWGSWFSRSSEKLKNLRSSGIRHDISVAFGEKLPIDTTPETLKKRICDLSIDSWEHYTANLPTIGSAFIDTAKCNGDELSVADSIAGSLNNNKFLTSVICFSRLIKKHSPEQNIGLLLPTSSAGCIANMATIIRGKTVVNLNFTSSREALQASVTKAGVKSIYTSRKFMEKLVKKGIDLNDAFPDSKFFYMEDLKEDISKATSLRTLLTVLISPACLLKLLYCKREDINSPAAILFSSGSEGTPKGIMLSHRNIMANLKQISDMLNTQDTDVIMASLPLFHAIGLTATTFMPLVEGIPVVCHPDPTDVVNVAKAIAKYRATVLIGTSTFLRLYTKNRRIHPLMLESLRIVIAGAERLRPDVREAFKLKFNKDIYEGYGATETTPVASVNIPDALDVNYWKVQQGNKLGTVGMPLPGTSYRIVDPDSLEELTTGEDGLILIGGSQVMLGYLDDEEKTNEVITIIDDTRWYKTGDKGQLDEDGFLTIVDRYSRFAKLGGEMVSLTAVEDAVRTALDKPELELVAINLPDEKKGEKIALIITEEIQLEEIKKGMLEAKANSLMIPSDVKVVDEIPKLGSGKTDFKMAKKLLVETS
ncbi:MAG TPA: acyl-[ACP]--phospholipid O-acyltransferase [Gammaproteobacteria bacterium]|jgi:acyl-[acyl-carrier-protein]-phospholipid O-acyltransferase/long-chain-fatty-acid--[acyl-carrier-protein] ligase|nr:acyl-[ACP]--phospholipid O-acyltransferase [Gammaproteobacteria bacterium]